VKPYYECHITMRGGRAIVELLVKAEHWKFSAIDGDPVLGDGVLCYATHHFKGTLDTVDVVNAMGIVADRLRDQGVEVIRQKVELVVFDTKSAHATQPVT
jgi:hypothetical protein